MQIVRDFQARIEIKKEVMEEEQHENARLHAQLQSVVQAKIKEAAALRKCLNDIALALERATATRTGAEFDAQGVHIQGDTRAGPGRASNSTSSPPRCCRRWWAERGGSV